jgi:CubicO group peptidase (beta-lactamase class C family)
VLTGLGIVAGLAALFLGPVASSAQPIDATVADRIRSYVTAELAALGAPGAAVAVVHADQVVLAEGFGEAGGREITAETPFDLASVSKSLTAIGVLQLAESGALDLDDPVTRHIGWFDDVVPELGSVTVRDLLGHASGWTIGDGQANLADQYAGPDAIERNVRRLASIPPTNPRGSFEYSNANYDVLAHLIEVVSGEPYAEYMTRSVFEPLEMAHAHVARTEADADGLAQGYAPILGVTLPFEVPYVAGGAGSGFLHASATDLAHTLVFHLNDGRYDDHQVLGAEWVDELHRPSIYADSVSGYAGGLWTFPFWPAQTVDTSGDVPEYRVPMTLQHEGDHSSTATAILLFPEERWGVVTLLPMNDSAAPSRFHQLDDGIGAIVLGLEPPATVAYEDLLAQHVRLVLVAIAAVQVVGIVIASRRLRRWSAAPASAPRGAGGAIRHVVVPAAVDVLLPVAVWLFYLDQADAPINVAFAYAPDIVLLMVAITALGIGWGTVRTLRTIGVMSSPSAPEPAPGAASAA